MLLLNTQNHLKTHLFLISYTTTERFSSDGRGPTSATEP